MFSYYVLFDIDFRALRIAFLIRIWSNFIRHAIRADIEQLRVRLDPIRKYYYSRSGATAGRIILRSIFCREDKRIKADFHNSVRNQDADFVIESISHRVTRFFSLITGANPTNFQSGCFGCLSKPCMTHIYTSIDSDFQSIVPKRFWTASSKLTYYPGTLILISGML